MRIRVGCHASPNCTAQGDAPSLEPPTQLGGRGDSAGRGPVVTWRNLTNVPSYETVSLVQKSLITERCSLAIYVASNRLISQISN